MRRFLRPLLLVALPLVAAALALQWYARASRWAETDNAYVKSYLVAISAEVSGRVAEVAVRDAQRVDKGAPLFRIDPAPFQLALERAQAQLAVTRTEIETLRADYRTAQLDADETAERIGFLERQYERQRLLKEKGMSREDQFDEARNTLETARKRLIAQREKAKSALAALDGRPDAPAERHPRYLQALAAVETAQLDLRRTEVKAPAAGVVTNMRLQPGMHVERGAPAFSLVDGGPPWIEANYKETQLTDVREGQAATFTVDAYPGLRWRARVAAIGQATGAEFAVLPPQNATGNWVKVVQRLPVRLEVEEHAKRPPLRAGMTVTVTVDTGRERGALDLVLDLLRPANAGDE